VLGEIAGANEDVGVVRVVDLLFVDGEDYGSFDDPNNPDILIGSRYFAEHLPQVFDRFRQGSGSPAQTRLGLGLGLSGAGAVVVWPAVLALAYRLSALDVHTEELVERALEQVLRDTTALVVVHRPSTVALADRVALLHEGRIAAEGKHSDLMESSPEYVDVLSAQAEEVRA
jgi:hypothetical protein